MTAGFDEVNEATLAEYFGRLDPLVKPGTVLFVFGGAAVALLGAKIRTTVDIDVAAPYSRIDMASFREASEKAGLPVNPPPGRHGAYLELVGERMLSLPRPDAEHPPVVLFSGVSLTVQTASDSDLVASKLCRYDEQDMADIAYLVGLGRVTVEAVKEAVGRMPPAMRGDVVVRKNAANFETDFAMWRADR